MKPSAPPTEPCFLLPRICDTVRLRLDGKCAPLCIDNPPAADACFASGALSGCPCLQSPHLSPLPNEHGTQLHAQLHLPVMLCYVCGCEQFTCPAALCLSIQALLRTPCMPSLQIYPQAELLLHTVFPQNGCLCAEFDLCLCLYAAQLQPVQLPAPCPEPPQPDCAPFFHLPLYPELPHACTSRKDIPWNAKLPPCPHGSPR